MVDHDYHADRQPGALLKSRRQAPVRALLNGFGSALLIAGSLMPRLGIVLSTAVSWTAIYLAVDLIAKGDVPAGIGLLVGVPLLALVGSVSMVLLAVPLLWLGVLITPSSRSG